MMIDQTTTRNYIYHERQKSKSLCAYLRNFVMGAVTCRADLIIWCFRKLLFHFHAPNRPNPWILFTIHEADGNVLPFTPEAYNQIYKWTGFWSLEHIWVNTWYKYYEIQFRVRSNKGYEMILWSLQYLFKASWKESCPLGANIIDAKDAAAAGCCVVSIIREKTLSTLVEWSAYTCLSISSMLLGSLIFCHLNH